MDKSKYPCVHSDKPMDYVKCALAIEILAYHNRDFLAYADNTSVSEQVQILLERALKCDMHNNEYGKMVKRGADNG